MSQFEQAVKARVEELLEADPYVHFEKSAAQEFRIDGKLCDSRRTATTFAGKKVAVPVEDTASSGFAAAVEEAASYHYEAIANELRRVENEFGKIMLTSVDVRVQDLEGHVCLSAYFRWHMLEKFIDLASSTEASVPLEVV